MERIEFGFKSNPNEIFISRQEKILRFREELPGTFKSKYCQLIPVSMNQLDFLTGKKLYLVRPALRLWTIKNKTPRGIMRHILNSESAIGKITLIGMALAEAASYKISACLAEAP